MQTPTPLLPESEKTRLQKSAYEYADNSHDLYATTHRASSISYFAGAKAEYIASLSRQKDNAIAFFRFMNSDWRHGIIKKTDSEMYDLFLQSLNKQV